MDLDVHYRTLMVQLGVVQSREQGKHQEEIRRSKSDLVSRAGKEITYPSMHTLGVVHLPEILNGMMASSPRYCS